MDPASLFVPVFFGFLDDMFLVLQVLVISYILFLLYMSFRDQPVIFAVASIVGFYFLLVQPIPLVFLLIFIFFIIMFGNQLQMILMFGLFPVLEMLGVKTPNIQAMGQEAAIKAQEIEQRILQGEQVSQAERELYAEHLSKQQQLQNTQQQIMSQEGRRVAMRR